MSSSRKSAAEKMLVTVQVAELQSLPSNRSVHRRVGNVLMQVDRGVILDEVQKKLEQINKKSAGSKTSDSA